MRRKKMIRANVILTKKEEAKFKANGKRLAYSANGYVKRLILDELARIQKEEALEEPTHEAD